MSLSVRHASSERDVNKSSDGLEISKFLQKRSHSERSHPTCRPSKILFVRIKGRDAFSMNHPMEICMELSGRGRGRTNMNPP